MAFITAQPEDFQMDFVSEQHGQLVWNSVNARIAGEMTCSNVSFLRREFSLPNCRPKPARLGECESKQARGKSCDMLLATFN